MMTPMNKLRVKKAPQTMNTTKYMYAHRLASYAGCKSTPRTSTASAIISIQPSNVAFVRERKS